MRFRPEIAFLFFGIPFASFIDANIEGSMGNGNEFLDNCTGLIILQMSDMELSADLGQIQKIIRPGEIGTPFKFPFSEPQFIKIDNSVIPLVELYSYFGLKFRKKSDSTRIIIVDMNSKVFAFPVDKVKEIMTIRKGYNIKQLSMLPYSDNDCLIELVLDDKKYSLINFKRIMELLPKELHISGL